MQTADAVTSRDETPVGLGPIRPLAWLMTIGGAIGLGAALVLTQDKVTLLQDKVDGKESSFACDLSAWVSCSSVIGSDQSSAFGFPNSFMGVVGFTIVVVLGVLYAAQRQLPEFVWAGLQAGVVFAIGFITWLQYQSIVEINSLCPYCMVVWTVTIPIFVYVTRRNLQAWAPDNAVTRFVTNWHGLIVALWYVAVVAAIWFGFGDRIFIT